MLWRRLLAAGLIRPTATQLHCQPPAHLLLPAFISLKLLPLHPVFIDLSEQPFGLSYGLVIGPHPCRRLWGGGGGVDLSCCTRASNITSLVSLTDLLNPSGQHSSLRSTTKMQHFGTSFISHGGNIWSLKSTYIHLNVSVIFQHYTSLPQQIDFQSSVEPNK